MARAYAGVEVYHQISWPSTFLALTHGVYANATLFHVPSQAIRRILSELFDSLVAGGALFLQPSGRKSGGV